MAYITLNQIVDALEELESLQKQLLLRILEETNSSSETPVQSKFQTWMRFEPLDFMTNLHAHAVAKPATSRKNGTYRGRQCYLHKDCGHTFNDLTNTPVHGSKYPEKWASYLRAMDQGYSLRKCAELFGISLQASFEWRQEGSYVRLNITW